MTNRSTHWGEETKLYMQAKPFLLKPAGKEYLWGGRRLIDDFGKEAAGGLLAESWECSTHPDGVSLVASGEHSGRQLDEVLKEHPEYLGSHPILLHGHPGADEGPGGGQEMVSQDGLAAGQKRDGVWQLPILIKLIDAGQDLSVQVHPDDEYAFSQENGQLGKTEFWYVLEAARDARLVYGLHHEVSEEELRRSISEKTVEKYLQKIPVRKNDVFLIEAGTIHAIGAGTLVAEIQENSNLTYRLYDYDRLDADGQKRPLHVDQALAVASRKAAVEPRQPLRVLKYRPGYASEVLCRCKYFEVSRLLLNTEQCRTMAEYQADSSSFRVLLCLEGCGSILAEGEYLHFFKGDCIFVPASSGPLSLHGRAQLLDVRA